MKKRVALILSICMLFSAFIPVNIVFAVTTSGTVDFDSLAANSATNFLSSYLSPSEYQRTDTNATISINGTGADGTIAMGYNGAVYLNETLKLTARFGGDFETMSSSQWDAFYLRSQDNGFNMPYGSYSSNKYMFAFKNTGSVTLYRVNSQALTTLLTVNIPTGTNLTAENIYEECALTNANSVDITLKINGTAVITYSDTSAGRITTAGYFGVGAYQNTSTIVIGRYNPIMFGANKDEFPIGLLRPTSFSGFSEYAYKDIAAANFNFMVGLDERYGGNQMQLKALDYAEKYNLKMWLFDPSISSLNANESDKIADLIKDYKNKKAYLGNVFVDEPNVSKMQSMVTLDKEFKRIAPTSVPMMNLFSDYVSTSVLGASTWSNYLDTYINLYNPKYLLYDYYPLNYEGSNMGYGLCKSMSIIGQKASAKKIPLMTYIQSTPFTVTDRDITSTDLKWQMYMNLALGSRGVTYFTYATGNELSASQTKPSIIDYYGNKTTLYNAAATLNTEVKNIGKILLASDYKGMKIHSNVNPVQSYELSSFAPISQLTGGEYLTGCFETASGDKKLMVVNMGITNSTTANIVLQNDTSKYYYLWRNGVRTTCVVGSNNTISVDLAVGEGVFIELGPTNIADLDEMGANSPSDFSSAYLSPSQYQRVDANGSISIKGTDANGTVAMGYNALTFLNTNIRFTAKFEGDFATMPASRWNAFYLRSQDNGYNMPFNDYSSDKYMFTFNNTKAVTLYRVNNHAITQLATATLGADVTLTANNQYEERAITNSNSVDITLKVNGVSVISYSDTAANRIATAGYFGVAANENSSTITIGKRNASITSDLDKIITNLPSAFSLTYLAPSQYQRTDENATISVKGTVVDGTIAMGYTGATYLNENLKFSAKFTGDFATMPASRWNAFYLRSQGNGYNLPFNDWSNDKYMFAFCNTKAVTLYRVNNHAITQLASATLAENVTLTSENQYEESAVTTLNSVDITLKVNGVSVISYSDTAANRITTAGYFGVAANENTSTIVVGKLDSPITAEIDDIIANSTSSFSSDYLTPSQYQRIDADSTISIKGTASNGIIALGYTGSIYLNETIKVTAKFSGSFASAPGWDAFYLRSQGNGYNMPINDWANDKYMFGFNNANLVTLYRVNGGAYTILSTATLPAGVNLTVANQYEECAITALNSVDITLKVNGVTVITYSDTATNRITTAGYFGVAAYANDSTITLGKYSGSVEQIPSTVPNIDVNDYAGHYRQWLSNKNIDITTSAGYIKGTEAETVFYHPGLNLKDASYKVTAKINFVPDTWGEFAGFAARCLDPTSAPYAAGNKGYLVAVSTRYAHLYVSDGVSVGNCTELVTVPCTIFTDGLEHSVEFAIWDDGNTVRIVFNVDGNKLIDFSHTGASRITTAGYFEGFINNGNSLTIGSGKNLETSNANINLGNFTVSPTKQITKVQPNTKVSTFMAILKPLDNVGVTLINASGVIQVADYASTLVGTGLVVSVTASDQTTTTYTIVINGDVDGTGTININDLAALKAHLLKSKILTVSDKLAAGDIYKDGLISVKDLLAVKKHLLGISLITP